MALSTLLAILPTAFVANRLGKELDDEPIYQDRMARGCVGKPQTATDYATSKGAKTSVGVCLVATFHSWCWAFCAS
ncbi:anaerobic C4-dicarboxylate transporter family protein [Corynebacterium cystitidis]|uniref:anaerobic C4-dicarboxylate transporter family protein n=1 Tax=Corynebacterium cystitidis TaxID=35757 RepID=UPI00358DCA71